MRSRCFSKNWSRRPAAELTLTLIFIARAEADGQSEHALLHPARHSGLLHPCPLFPEVNSLGECWPLKQTQVRISILISHTLISHLWTMEEVLPKCPWATGLLTHFIVSLTSTERWWSWPLSTWLADSGWGALAFITTVTVVFTGGTIVVPCGGAGEVAVLGWFQNWTASHCQGEAQVRGCAISYSQERLRGPLWVF